jgi:hypothetical protein
LNARRSQIIASIGTRLAIGAYPLVFLLAFGWAFGKEAFDVAAAANNWANYLNVLLLSGFVLVPPAVARLRGPNATEADRAIVRDHVSLERALLFIGPFAAAGLWATIGMAFPELARQSGNVLGVWNLLFAILALTQLPLTLWLGVAQAAGRYNSALFLVAAPRALAVAVLLAGGAVGADPTVMIAASVTIVVTGQWGLARSARAALRETDATIFEQRGDARAVLIRNLLAGAVALVATLVTIVPVTIVGHLLPQEVGHAQVIVTLSNAITAVIVAAFFPLSLTLAEHANDAAGRWRHSMHIARSAALITVAILAAAWLAFPLCAWASSACSANVFAVGSLVVCGAGLRLGSLGAYHATVYMGHPHYSLLSVGAEAIAVSGLTWWLLGTWTLYGLGAAFVVGGGLRMLIALAVELKLLAARAG